MARSARIKIVMAAAGLAGVAMLAGGGMAFADPGDGRTTVEIVERADTTSTTAGYAHDGKDCPGGGPSNTRAADSR